MLAVCCRGAGGNILHKPEMRQDSSSRNGRRDGALSACSCSLCLTQTRGRCRAADTWWDKLSECWASIESTAVDEKRKREESMGLFCLDLFWGNCLWSFGLVTLLYHWKCPCEWNLGAASWCTWRDSALERKECFWRKQQPKSKKCTWGRQGVKKDKISERLSRIFPKQLTRKTSRWRRNWGESSTRIRMGVIFELSDVKQIDSVTLCKVNISFQ